MALVGCSFSTAHSGQSIVFVCARTALIQTGGEGIGDVENGVGMRDRLPMKHFTDAFITVEGTSKGSVLSGQMPKLGARTILGEIDAHHTWPVANWDDRFLYIGP